MKRSLSILLAAVLLISLFAGCATEAPGETTVTTAPTETTVPAETTEATEPIDYTQYYGPWEYYVQRGNRHKTGLGRLKIQVGRQLSDRVP